MNSFTREETKEMRETLNKEFAKLGKKLNICIGEIANIKFGDEITFKLRITKAPAAGKTVDFNKIDWDKYCRNFGLGSNDFGKKVSIRNAMYVIDGINPRSTKYPITARRADGKRFKFTSMSVRSAIMEGAERC